MIGLAGSPAAPGRGVLFGGGKNERDFVMNMAAGAPGAAAPIDSGLAALCGIAAYYRIAADPAHLAKELALSGEADDRDLLRAAKLIGLKARIVENPSESRLASAPVPAILRRNDGTYCVFAGETAGGLWRVVDPVTRISREISFDELIAEIDPLVILIARRFHGAGVDPRNFGFLWFAPSLWRYRKPLAHVLIASFFVQIFALIVSGVPAPPFRVPGEGRYSGRLEAPIRVDHKA